ncbi:anthranilate phosphoribosyltransferase [Andreesenia angusta]|uniref:Anthranilate phosphoribosyltransferase n=1 Tax=Andreesenia angusta TaxID=39480 RepID=A0A1S1V9E5_9FIRM|nr:anthranilate phosphoribosyltransferase [Andreesenia angusta]OHW63212.1 anthranilate phosphoribosyltransferase [Andreesenia angusta]
MFKKILSGILDGHKLSTEEAKALMNYMMKGELTESQISAILIALKMRGETPEEISGFVLAMREHAVRVAVDSYAIDTCGTGGDGKNTFNISTLVAIIASAGGVPVLKHGNKSVSSKSGSADVLREIGFDIEMTREEAEECFKQNDMAFLFAPNYHKSMKNVAGVRGELGIRTVFNILGPLINPAEVKGQVLGVFDPKLTGIMADVLKRTGTERAMIVHGSDGLDEITITGKTIVSELKDGEIINYEIDPRDYGIAFSPIESVVGGEAAENAGIMRSVLSGEQGPKRDIVLLNSAAALYIGKAAKDFGEGIEFAREIIDSGAAMEKLEKLIKYSGGLR